MNKHWKELKNGIAGLVDEGLDSVARGVSRLKSSNRTDLSKVTGSIKQKVEDNGGLKGIAKEVVNDISGVINYSKRTFGNTKQTIDEQFFTEGFYDSSKAREFAQTYTSKTFELISGFADQGKDVVMKEVRKRFPSDEEMKNVYAGIGTQNDKILLRDDLDRVLSYHEVASEAIHPNVRVKKEILTDLKASASTSKDELVAFYMTKGTEEAYYKLERVEKYL